MRSALCCLFVALALDMAVSDDVILQKRVYFPGEYSQPLDPKRKRPFCNAFTGCGRKRADESMAGLVGFNSEPAVEELSRQILSEAKLWEAIQEARMELARRRSEERLDRNNWHPLPLAGLNKRSIDQGQT